VRKNALKKRKKVIFNLLPRCKFSTKGGKAGCNLSHFVGGETVGVDLLAKREGNKESFTAK